MLLIKILLKSFLFGSTLLIPGQQFLIGNNRFTFWLLTLVKGLSADIQQYIDDIPKLHSYDELKEKWDEIILKFTKARKNLQIVITYLEGEFNDF